MWSGIVDQRARTPERNVVLWNCSFFPLLGLLRRHWRSEDSVAGVGRWCFHFFIFISVCCEYDHNDYLKVLCGRMVCNNVRRKHCAFAYHSNSMNFSVAGATSAGYSYISEFHTARTAPRAAAFISIGLYCVWPFMSPLAMLVIPMDWQYSLYFVEFKPWRLFMMSTSLVNLINAIISSFIPESPKFLLSMNKKDEALEVLSRVYAINTGKSKNVTNLMLYT